MAANANCSAEYPPEWMPFCHSIEDFLQNRAINIVISCQVVLLGATLLGIAILVQQYFRHKIVVHPNLLLMFANIIVLYLIYILSVFAIFLRYRILLFFYKHPCELLTPVWMVPFLVAPNFLYVLAFPAFHFFIMVERVRATFLAEKYEQEGIKFGIKIAIIIWIISLAYMVYVILSGFADTETFSHPQGIVTLTNNYNNLVNMCVLIFTLPMVIITALGDWRITAINREAKKNSEVIFGQYNLSRNYQLNENALTMRLILPLDIAYACLYFIYQALIAIIRALKPSMNLNDFIFYYYLANTILYIYIAVAIIVYIQFVRFLRRKRRFNVNKILPEQNDETNVYFKQLKSQWA